MQLFYRTKGDKTHPPLIILHGLWGASDNWLQVAEQLCQQFHVILPDLRNHGQSPHHEIMDYDSMSQDISIFIKKLHLSQQPAIVGHSMGGKILMTLLLKEPTLVKKAAILDIAPISYPILPDSFHQTLIDFMLNFPLSSYTHRESIHQRIREHFSSETLKQIVFKNLRKGVEGFEWKINIPSIHKNMDKLLGWPTTLTMQEQQTPMLFIRGEKSTYITPSAWEATCRIFPDAQLATIQEAGHFLHAEQPNELAQTLMQFFTKPFSL